MEALPVSSSAPAALPGGRQLHIRLAIVRAVFGIFPSFSLNRIRLLALKACGIRMGRVTMFWGLPKLMGPGPIASRLRIGTHCGFNLGCKFDLSAPIAIGNHVSVGHEVSFLTTRTRDDGVQTALPIAVEEGVWLGARCTLLGGVTVGAGSVIGAGVTVTEDVPPNTLLTGGRPISLAKWR